MKTLVLDSNWQPIRIISWEQAMKDIYSDRAKQIKTHPDKKVRTVTEEYDVPCVVQVVANKEYRSNRIACNSANVYFRDKFTCAYCGERKKKSELTLDHIFPIVQGGKSSWKNLITACKPCNQTKGGRTPQQANMKLKFRPYVPRWSLAYALKLASQDLIPLWSDFLFGMDEIVLGSNPVEVE